MSVNGEGNGEQGVTHVKVPVLMITLDPVSLQVSLRCDNVPIGVAQMMLDEARRQLDIMRRQAAAAELQKQLVDAQRTADLVRGLKFPR